MSAIHRILAACVDDEQMLDRGDHLDAGRSAALTRLAEQRREFRDALSTAGRTLRGAPRARPSWLGVLRRSMLDLRMVAAGPNAGDVLTACRRSSYRLEARLEWALARGWNREIEQLLVEEQSRVVRDREVLVSLYLRG